jgi:transcriptional regulator with XRE-family HTH domain
MRRIAHDAALEMPRHAAYTDFLTPVERGFTMFSVANLLERAKAGGNIESDYRLAKVIGISHGTMTGYRSGKTKPDARVLEQLCALSGDDVAVLAAQLQAERERTPEGKTMWLMVAKRLAGGASTAILSVCFAIALIAAPAQSARATTLNAYKTGEFSLLYIVSSTFLTVQGFLLVRLRCCAHGLPALLRLCLAAAS